MASQWQYQICLKILDVKFKGVNVLENQKLRQGIKRIIVIGQQYLSFILKKEFIGGCDIVKEMFENGELKTII